MKLLDNFSSPILITGCPRSGSSIVAGAIAYGAFGGFLTENRFFNSRFEEKIQIKEKGMFENIPIREMIEKTYLKDIAVDVKGQYPLPNIDSLAIPNDWKEKIKVSLFGQGYDSDLGKWFYKSARMALLWPIWHHAFPDAKWIIVRRRAIDIVQSSLETISVNVFKNKAVLSGLGVTNEKEGWLWLIKEYEARFIAMINAGLNIKIIWPERMAQGDYRQVIDIIEWTGLSWQSEMLSFIDPKFWKLRKREGQTYGSTSDSK